MSRIGGDRSMHFRTLDNRHPTRCPGGSFPGSPFATKTRATTLGRDELQRDPQGQRRPDPAGPVEPSWEAMALRLSIPRRPVRLLRRRGRDALTPVGVPGGGGRAWSRRAQGVRRAWAWKPSRIGLRRRPDGGRHHREQDQRDQELDAMAIHTLHAPSTTGDKRRPHPIEGLRSARQGFLRERGPESAPG
jgi:hypothetical protein